MAQSIRISDELYDMAQNAAAALERSLAQQIEYWARLGLALDAAGVTSTDAMQLMAGEPVAKYFVAAAHGRGNTQEEAAASIAARHAKLEQEVRSGQRTPESLFALPAESMRKARVKFPKSDRRKGSGW